MPKAELKCIHFVHGAQAEHGHAIHASRGPELNCQSSCPLRLGRLMQIALIPLPTRREDSLPMHDLA